MDSSGLGVLVLAHQRSEMTGTQLRVLSGAGQVRDLLDLTGVIDLLDLTD